jgi:pre-rRNA-processing protein TSR1
VLKDVPQTVVEGRNGRPFIVHGLFQHEHKQSVLHFAVQRNTEYTEPVKAKVSATIQIHPELTDMSQDPLILCAGPRRYLIRPLYSQHARGGGKGVNNVHKSEKFLRPGGAVVATTFGPVCFGKVPCLLLKDEGEGKRESRHSAPESNLHLANPVLHHWCISTEPRRHGLITPT